ncbi:hypothetical protein NSQ62_14315 [Solibacillus sp. FSL H8-0523]|uniref:hypothetical protein n=1 Tax=Solibacillus sp. FSL H8-0523 TaxID=2954511 RepID=UPI0031010CD1
MHEYKITVRNNQKLEFESSKHITKMHAVDFGGVPFVIFEDARMAVNLLNVKELVIDGISFKLRGYAVH